MVITINIPDNAVQIIKETLDLLGKALMIFGGSAAAVKFTGTLPKGHALLPVIKLLARITNNMSKDEEIRNGQNKT